MKDLILKWWNRKWSDWEFDQYVNTYYEGLKLPTSRHKLLTRKSNDGLVQYKRIKVY